MYAKDILPGTTFYHGTKADLNKGQLLHPGFESNFVERGLKHVYFSAKLEGAIWGAELARGEGPNRVYTVEPTGAYEDDPNLTDKRYVGNPTASYRSADPLRITGEVNGWVGHSPDVVAEMKANLARLNASGKAEIIE